MAESERVGSPQTTASVSLPSRKRLGVDATAKRFQDELLSIDFFSARVVELPETQRATDPQVTSHYEPIDDSSTIRTEEDGVSSEKSDEEESEVNPSSLSESYPLLCNPVSCRAPEGEPDGQEPPPAEKMVDTDASSEDQKRANRKESKQRVPSTGEVAVSGKPSMEPAQRQATVAASESEFSPLEANAEVTKDPELSPSPKESEGAIEPIVADWAAMRATEESEGRNRSKRSKNVQPEAENVAEASGQLSAMKEARAGREGIAVPAELRRHADEAVDPTLEIREAELPPKSRRSDRLDRDKRSGNDAASIKDEGAMEIPDLSFSFSDGSTNASLALASHAEIPFGTESIVSGEMATSGLTEVPAASLASINSNSLQSAVTITASSGDMGMANATGAASSMSMETTTSLGASTSLSGVERVGANSSAPAGSSPVRGSLTSYQESKLVQRVLRGFEQLRDGGGQVRLRLHPPELGTLQMTLRIESMQVSARLEVENTVARDALLQNAQTLKDQLAAQGFEVERFEVEIRSEVGGDSTGLEQRSDRRGEDARWQTLESRYAAMQSNRISDEEGDTPLGPSRTPWFRNGNNLDLTV
jgi:flagellar hook-length control protein FliK